MSSHPAGPPLRAVVAHSRLVSAMLSFSGDGASGRR